MSNLDIRTRIVNGQKSERDARKVGKAVDGVGDATERAGTKARGAGRAFGFLDRQMEGLNGRVRGLASGIRGGLGGALAVSAAGFYGLGRGTKFAVSSAINLGEEVSKTTVVFRGSEQEVLKWSKGTARALGISQRQALEAAGVFGNMLVPMGLSRGRAADMSKSMVGLAADMASFNNASPEETLDALRAGLAGETEPLRRYGVMLSAARVEQEALRLSGKKSKDDLTTAEKAQASYNLILKDTKDAQGDVARTSSSLANRQRQLKALWENIAAGAGKLALPALENLAGGAATFLGQIEKGTGAGGRFVSRVKGIASAAKSAGGSLLRGAKGAIAGARGGVAPGGEAGSVGLKVGKALKFAAGAAKSAGEQLMAAFKPAVPFLQNVLLPVVKGFAAGLAGGLVGAFHVTVTAVRLFATGLGWLGRKARPLRPLFVGIGAVLGFLATGPFLKAFTAVGRLAAGATRVGKAFGSAGSAIKGAMGGALRYVTGLASKFAKAGQTLVARLLGGLKGALANGAGFAAGIGDALRKWLNDKTLLGDEVKAGPVKFRLPALARGGDITQRGSVMVGERGPEVLDLPAGARVRPLNRQGPMTPALAGVGDVRTAVYLDGRQIAEAVGQVVRNRQARR